MRILFTVLALALSVTAHASGRASFQLSEYSNKPNIYPLLGLAVDEKLVGPLHINGWGGIGSRPVRDDVKNWTSAKLGLDFYIKRVVIGFGGFVNSTLSDDDSQSGSESGAYAKLSAKLW